MGSASAGRVSAALAGMDVQQAGAPKVPQAVQGIGQLLDVVAVDGAEVAEAQGLEQGAAAAAHQVGLGVDNSFLKPVAGRPLSHGVPHLVFDAVVEGMGGQVEQVVMHASGILVDGDVVVVEDDEDVGLGGAGIVESLPGQAAGKGAVPDDGHAPLPRSLHAGGLGKAQGGRYGSGRMARPEGVVGALVPLGETADALQVRFLRKASRRPVRILWA